MTTTRKPTVEKTPIFLSLDVSGRPLLIRFRDIVGIFTQVYTGNWDPVTKERAPDKISYSLIVGSLTNGDRITLTEQEANQLKAKLVKYTK